VLGPAAIALAHLALHPEARLYMYDSGATPALVRQVLECKSPSVRQEEEEEDTSLFVFHSVDAHIVFKLAFPLMFFVAFHLMCLRCCSSQVITQVCKCLSALGMQSEIRQRVAGEWNEKSSKTKQ